MGSPRVVAGVPSSAVAGTGQGSPGFHQKVLKWLGNPQVPYLQGLCPRPFMCSGPHSASSAKAIFIPCSFQSTALVGGMGQQEEREGLQDPTGCAPPRAGCPSCWQEFSQ